MTVLDAALDYHARGLSVIPVPLPIPGTPSNTPGDGKTPAITWKGYQTTRPTEAQIRRWFASPQNVAILCGALSGVVAVDADSDAALRWLTQHFPYTPWQSRTAQGFHALYRYPGVPVRNKAKLHTGDGRIDLDVRADGGYIIAPPSSHMGGHVYRRAGDWTAPITELPIFDPRWIAAPARPATPRPRIASTAPIVDRARKYLHAIPPPVIGAGSDVATLYAAARLRRGFDLSEQDTVMLLDEWAGQRPGWDRHWIAAKVRNAERFGTEPIGAMR